MQTLLTEKQSCQDIQNLLPSWFQGIVVGDGDFVVSGVAAFEANVHASLSYCSIASPPQTGEMESDRVVLCSPENQTLISSRAKIVTSDPRAAFIALVEGWVRADAYDFSATLVQDQDFCDGKANIDDSASIEADVMIGEDAQIGPGVIIHRGCIIGPRTKIRAGAVIGEEGIATYKGVDGSLNSQPHIGTVAIGSDCEIGANVVICRAMLGRTLIGNDTIIGNLCNIGHGVQIDERVWMSVGCFVGGHATIGALATIGMGAVIRDNISIGARASLGMGSIVVKSVEGGQSVFGNPAKPVRSKLVTGPNR